jgi:hypothetical protein
VYEWKEQLLFGISTGLNISERGEKEIDDSLISRLPEN